MNVKRNMAAFVATLGGCVLLVGIPPAAHAFDPLLAERSVSATAAADMLNGETCDSGELPAPLQLQHAVERALCNHPKTRSAWAEMKVRAAAVGRGRAAFLPTLNGNWQGTRDIVRSRVPGSPQFDSNQATKLQSVGVSLNWVLYDFGARSAGLRNSTELLAAAQANQHAALQKTLTIVAKHFYAAQAAQAALVSARQIEETARSSVDVAAARVGKGVAAISDQLQAQTAYAEAVVSLTRAATDWQTALGMLASDMNLDPFTTMELPDVGESVAPDEAFTESVDTLIRAALRDSPGAKAAEANVRAARADADRIRREGAPRLSLVGQYNFNNQPTSVQLGVPALPARRQEWYVGLQLSIPLFEGFARTYQVKQANAQTELQLDLLAEVRQRLGLEVWSGYQSVNGATANLGHSATLLRLAQRAYDAALRRYESGVGGILELLNSQAALARAKQQKVQALTDWRVARLELAAALGKLGVSHLDDEHLSSNVGIEATISAIADLSAKTPSTPDERLRATAAR